MPTATFATPAILTLSLLGLALAPGRASAGAVVNVYAQVYQNYEATPIPIAINRRTEAGAGAVADTATLFSSGPSASTGAAATAFANVGHLSARAAGHA